MFQNKVNSQKE